MPMLVRLFGMLESIAFGRGANGSAIQSTGRLEHAVDGRRADRDHVLIEHHEAQSPVAFERMSVMEVDDGVAFPVLEPPIARNLAVMRVGLAVSSLPLVELARRQSEPVEQLLGGQPGALIPVVDVVDDVVSRIMGNPATFQGSPFSFFERMFSSISSAITSFFASSFSRRC